MIAALLLLKTLFGSIFGFIFSDWRVTLLIVILAACGWLGWKYHTMQKHLVDVQQSLVLEEANNKTLRDNLQTAVQANQQNQQIITQLQSDSQRSQQQVTVLNSKINARDKQIDGLATRLASQPAQPITPNIRFTVESIQQMRKQGAAR